MKQHKQITYPYEEEWRPILGALHPKQVSGIDMYEVSSWGRVRHKDKQSPLRPGPKSKYLAVNIGEYITKNGKRRSLNVYVHALVALGFFGIYPTRSSILCVNHLDGNTYNNGVWNLEVVTYAANRNHSLYTLGSIQSYRKFRALTDAQVRRIRYEYHTNGQTVHRISKKLKIAAGIISHIINNTSYKDVA